jgi:hypothetical protein
MTDNEWINVIKNQNITKTDPNLPTQPTYFGPEDGGSMHIRNVDNVSLIEKSKRNYEQNRHQH